MGELHLEIIVDRMKREFGVEATVGKPSCVPRNNPKTCEEIEGKFVKQSGGRGQYGHVVLKIEPAKNRQRFSNSLTRSKAVQFHVNTSLQLRKGILETLPSGVLAGYPVVDVKVTLFFGSYHDVDSTKTPSVWLLRWRSKTAAVKQAGHLGTNDGS